MTSMARLSSAKADGESLSSVGAWRPWCETVDSRGELAVRHSISATTWLGGLHTWHATVGSLVEEAPVYERVCMS
jgi:hypothetical protein